MTAGGDGCSGSDKAGMREEEEEARKVVSMHAWAGMVLLLLLLLWKEEASREKVPSLKHLEGNRKSSSFSARAVEIGASASASQLTSQLPTCSCTCGSA